jgi:hypothetical protein
MKRMSTTLFGINTVNDYLEFCREAIEALAQQQDSVLRGFTAILALNHLADWIEVKVSKADLIKARIRFNEAPCKKRDQIEASNPDLKIVRQIANGFKHLRPVYTTQRIAGYARGPNGVGPFGAPYLLIDLGEDQSFGERWCVGLDLCKRVLAWWQTTLAPILHKEGS